MLDMATTVAAYGKVKTQSPTRRADARGLDDRPRGQAADRPAPRDEGFLLPIGEYKGYGLALVFGLLAGTLNGAAFGRDVVDFNHDDVTPTNTGQWAAIDIAAFGDPAAFGAAAGRAFAEMRASPPLPGHDPVRIPGDGRGAARAAGPRKAWPCTRRSAASSTPSPAELGIRPRGATMKTFDMSLIKLENAISLTTWKGSVGVGALPGCGQDGHPPGPGRSFRSGKQIRTIS